MSTCNKLHTFVALLAFTLLAWPATTRAQDPELLITELMASNDSTFSDTDGCYHDWVEIHNPSLPMIDIDGWYLTDDPADLTKWQFPSRLIPRGQFVVVFASGLDRADAVGDLHANFKLGAGGEYLALVEPDGMTVAHEYTPQYPALASDVSFGVPQSATTVVFPGDSATYYVPASEDAGVEWTLPAFDDSTWDTGEIGFGFLGTALTHFNVTFYQANVTVSNLTIAESVISDPSKQAAVVVDTAAVINYLSTGNYAHYPGDAPFPDSTIGVDLNDFVVEVLGTVIIPAAGDWTFGVNSDDGFGLELTNGSELFSSSFPGTRGPGDTLATFSITQPGPYDLRLVSFERGGGAEVELFAAPGSLASWNADDFTLLGDTANGGLMVVGFNGEVRSDVEQAMLGVNASLWTRITFDVADPNALSTMILGMKYEDGFSAYINGQEVASRNAPAVLQWDSAAASDRPLEESAAYEFIDLSDQFDVLTAGNNVLAIHALNDAAADPDFLLVPQLLVVEALTDLTPGFFLEPTPAAFNTAGALGFAGSLDYSHDSGTFIDPFFVTLIPDDPAAVIRYTLNGSEPTEASSEYTAPVEIATTTQIRARQFEADLAPGPVLGRAFVQLHSDVLDWDSNLPVFILENFSGGSVPTNIIQPAYMALFEPQLDGRSALTNIPDLQTRAGIKVRGSSTQNRPKKAYAVEARDELDDDLDIMPLGLPSESDWILYAAYNFDRALIRNAFIYELSNQVGPYGVRTRLCEVFINIDGGPLQALDYVGAYVFMEKIKLGPDRMDITELECGVNTEPDITGGYMLKIDRADPGDFGFFAAGQLLRYVDPKEEDITLDQAAWIKGFLDDMATALNGPDFTDPDLGYAPFIDVDAWIDHHLLNVLTKNPDGLRLSTYMHKDREAKLVMEPIWDFDRTMGCDDDLRAFDPVGFDPSSGTSYFTYPWWGRLFEDPDFMQKYIDRYQELRRDALTTANMDAIIDGMAAELAEAAERNFIRWPAVFPNSGEPPSWQGEIDHLKDWLAQRVEWLDTQWLAPPQYNQQGGEVPSGFNLTMTAPVGTILYTLDGSDPRAAGGAVSVAALTYTDPVVLTAPTVVISRVLDGMDWSGPNAATFTIDTLDISINELMVDNVSTIEDPDEPGEYPPWIELHSAEDATVEVSSLYLSTDLGDPTQWQVPVGTELCSGQRLLIWADGEPGDGPYHASFTLDPAGGVVALFTGGVLVDAVEYGPLPADHSHGRTPDGGDKQVLFDDPSPGAPNPLVETAVMLNEYNAVADDEFLENAGSDVFWGQVLGNGGDWFELVVVSNHVDMRGWELDISDDTGGPGEDIETLTLSTAGLWSDLRSGTIITVSEDLADDVSYDPLGGDWWINVQASNLAAGTYITNSNFKVSNDNWQLTIRDAGGAVVFGPAGEGINPPSGIGSREVCKLEEDPQPTTTPQSNYNDGSSSTFGAANVWSAGTVTQDFSVLRNQVVSCTVDSDCDTAEPCVTPMCLAGECFYGTTSPCYEFGVSVVGGVSDFCPSGTVTMAVEVSAVIEAIDMAEVLLGFDPTMLALASVLPGDGAGSPWDAATLDVTAEDGDVRLQLTLPAGSAAQATLATLEFDMLGVEGQAELAFRPPCPPQHNAVRRAPDGALIEPAVLDAAVLLLSACDDGDPCTVNSCIQGSCTYPAVDCSGMDSFCALGTCNPVSGLCEPSPINEGADCDDELLCTDNDVCVAGLCSGSAVDCSFLDDSCNTGTCEAVTGDCIAVAANEGGGCDDGVDCTLNDVCVAGNCVGLASCPVVVGGGSRYLLVTPAPGATSLALRVESPEWPCLGKYVDDTGGLGDTPVFHSAEEWGTVAIYGVDISPLTTYAVRADVREEAEPQNLSPAVEATTWLWGDGNDDGDVNISDIVCTLDGFRNVYNVCAIEGVDLLGSLELFLPDQSIDVVDIVAVLDAFRDDPFAGPQPCAAAPSPPPAGQQVARIQLVARQRQLAGPADVTVDVYVESVRNLRAFQVLARFDKIRQAPGQVVESWIDVQRDDYVFAERSDFAVVDPSSWRTASALGDGAVSVVSQRKYLGTFILRPGPDARGTLRIGLDGVHSYLLDSSGAEVDLRVTPAQIQIAPVGFGAQR